MSRFVSQLCVLPRARYSPEDALYCAKLITLLHEIATPRFSTIQVLDLIARTLVSTILCITEFEASNVGVFLHEVRHRPASAARLSLR